MQPHDLVATSSLPPAEDNVDTYNLKVHARALHARRQQRYIARQSDEQAEQRREHDAAFHWWLLNQVTPHGLVEACASGSIDLVRELLKRGVAASTPALATALDNRHFDISRLLLDNGARDNEQSTCLLSAARNGSDALFQQLLTVNPSAVCAKNSNGETPLFVLLKRRPPLVTVQLFIRAGADVRARDNCGNTTLLVALDGMLSTTIVKCLIDAGADVHARDSKGFTTLHHAFENALCAETIQCLVNAGADINEKSLRHGVFPLMCAVYGGAPGSVQTLIAAGASPHEAESDNGSSLLCTAIERQHSSCLESVVRELVDAGADVNKLNYYNSSPLSCLLYRLVQHQHEQCIAVARILVERGANRTVSKKLIRDSDPALIKLLNLGMDEATLERYHVAAESGDRVAQFNYGQAFFNGDGVAKDECLACSWWQKAADREHVLATYNLGCAYFDGLGVVKDASRACQLWQWVADRGDTNGLMNVAYALYEGIGLARSRKRAMRIMLQLPDCLKNRLGRPFQADYHLELAPWTVPTACIGTSAGFSVPANAFAAAQADHVSSPCVAAPAPALGNGKPVDYQADAIEHQSASANDSDSEANAGGVSATDDSESNSETTSDAPYDCYDMW
jgi:ankyrin repeat protein